jgi:hypothetical protein
VTVLQSPPSHLRVYRKCNNAKLEFSTIFVPGFDRMNSAWKMVSIVGGLNPGPLGHESSALTTRPRLHAQYNGEQTYCRKWIFDKMPKIVLGQNGKKIFPKYRLGTKHRIFFFLILICFPNFFISILLSFWQTFWWQNNSLVFLGLLDRSKSTSKMLTLSNKIEFKAWQITGYQNLAEIFS